MAGNIGHLSLYRRLACEVESSSTSQTCEKSLLVSRAEKNGTFEQHSAFFSLRSRPYKKMIGTDLIGFRGDSKHMFEILKA